MLLLVAPNEHRVRIEVGYGLEGTLTDALSKVIITNAIAPRFKTGDFGGGISRGVDDIITVLTTDSSEWQKRPSLRLDHDAARLDAVDWILLAGIFGVDCGAHRVSGISLVLLQCGGRTSWSVAAARAAAWCSGGGGFARLAAAFSGGGGSSGGGGASGSW